MTNTFFFLTFRYLAFASFVIFNSIICIVSALNLGSLTANTSTFPEIDAYLIFSGALGIAIVFPVVFIELIRQNAFITRVAVEITWIGLLWIMNLSGATALIAISSQMRCNSDGKQLEISCSSLKVLLAFTWLSTITLLSYLLVLVVSAVYHSQDGHHVWRSGVRDFKWYQASKSISSPPDAAFSYGKLIDPRDGPPPIYAQQMGLAKEYTIEPLRITTTNIHLAPNRFDMPAPPAPVASLGNTNLARDPHVNRAPLRSNTLLSLYPQQLNTAIAPLNPPRVGGPTPPPGGSWPRSSPQEPIRRKRPPKPRPDTFENQINSPEIIEQRPEDPSLLNASRSRPSGPRSVSQRHRPPPLNLSSKPT